MVQGVRRTVPGRGASGRRGDQARPWSTVEDAFVVEWYYRDPTNGQSPIHNFDRIAEMWQRVADAFYDEVLRHSRETNAPPTPRRTAPDVRAQCIEMGFAEEFDRTDDECRARLAELGVLTYRPCADARVGAARGRGAGRRG